jgi:hypothetical protein
MSNQVNSTYSPHISTRIFHFGGKQKRQKGVSPNSSSSREVCSASMTDDGAEKEERATSFQALHGQRDSAKAASRCAHPTPGKGGIVRSEAERPTKEKNCRYRPESQWAKCTHNIRPSCQTIRRTCDYNGSIRTNMSK